MNLGATALALASGAMLADRPLIVTPCLRHIPFVSERRCLASVPAGRPLCTLLHGSGRLLLGMLGIRTCQRCSRSRRACPRVFRPTWWLRTLGKLSPCILQFAFVHTADFPLLFTDGQVLVGMFVYITLSSEQTTISLVQLRSYTYLVDASCW